MSSVGNGVLNRQGPQRGRKLLDITQHGGVMRVVRDGFLIFGLVLRRHEARHSSDFEFFPTLVTDIDHAAIQAYPLAQLAIVTWLLPLSSIQTHLMLLSGLVNNELL